MKDVKKYINLFNKHSIEYNENYLESYNINTDCKFIGVTGSRGKSSACYLLYNYLIDKQDNFKYKKTIYHYKPEDFDSVQSYMTLNEAYEDWMKYTFPHLLEYYKRDRVR